VKNTRFWLALALCAILLAGIAGCGGSSPSLDEQQAVVDKAMRSLASGDLSRFLPLVAPSFVDEARRQMPEATDEELAGVLASGFRDQIPFTSIKSANYQTDVDDDHAVVHVWGSFVDSAGGSMEITQTQAIRVPLVKEEGRWYLDLLDI
jgi:hypothetical protein